MDKLTAMKVFCTVVETGAISRAAEAVGLSTAVVSRALANLEKELGSRLIHRTTRQLGVTDAGLRYYRRCVDIIVSLDEAEQAVREQDAEPKGLLRVSLPHNFGQTFIAPLLLEFQQHYPELELEMIFSDRAVDIAGEGFDLAIRVTGKVDDHLIARHLCGIDLVCCAAPGYLEKQGMPLVPEDLRKHNCLTYSYAGFGESWAFTRGQERSVVRVSGDLRANNGDVLCQAASHGMGIALVPAFLAMPFVRSGQLERVLADYELASFAAYAVYSTTARQVSKIKLLLTFLAERLPSMEVNMPG